MRPQKTVLPLSLSKASVRFLDTLPPKQHRQVTRKIIMLMADSQPTDAERLRGHEYSRVTFGEYRAVFAVHDGVLCIIAIGKRNEEVDRRLGRGGSRLPRRCKANSDPSARARPLLEPAAQRPSAHNRELPRPQVPERRHL